MGELTHPAVRVLSDLLGPDWQPFDLLVREDQAAIVEMRQDELREAHILVTRRAEWVAPGLLTRSPTQVPGQRPGVTAILGLQRHASGWPSSDGEPPSEVWMSIDGTVARDAMAISLTTSTDHFQSSVRDDGTFLVLVRANRGEEPRAPVHLRTGEQLEALL